jgi:hypothetical protein
VIAKPPIIWFSEVAMAQLANLQFERAVREFIRWRAVPEKERSPAPAWWWGPAFELRHARQPMPAEWCSSLGLPDGSPLADGADVFLKSLADQTSLPWPDDFPQRPGYADPPPT